MRIFLNRRLSLFFFSLSIKNIFYIKLTFTVYFYHNIAVIKIVIKRIPVILNEKDKNNFLFH